MYRARRRRLLLGVVLILLLADAAAHLHSGAVHPLVPPSRARNDPFPAAVSWPVQGQAAFVLGDGPVTASPDQQPVPIASLAKVMTAYLTLRRYPLSEVQEGFGITITSAQAQEEAQDAAENQSGVAVAPGEELTERQLLEALLIPSGNNIARILAAQVAGSEASFVAAMNSTARALGMGRTIYTDPSGFDPGTVSTAADQLRVFEAAMRLPAFRQVVSMPDVTLPVAGTLTNFNPLIDEGYVGKTGSDSAAGGCLAFATDVTVGGAQMTAAGVVLGQGQGSDTRGLLGAAAEAATQLIESLATATGAPTTGTTRTAGGPERAPATSARGPLLAQRRIPDHPGSERPLDPQEHA